MKLLQLVGVIICAQIVRHVSTHELTQFKNTNKQDPVEYPDVIIKAILHHSDTKKLASINVPVGVTQIRTTLGYSQQRIHAATGNLKGENIYFDRVLALRTEMDVVFDTISQMINSLESSFGAVCLNNFGLFDVQSALQVVIDVCVSSNWPEGEDVVPIMDVGTFSEQTVFSSVYLLSSAIKSFITSAANFAKTTISPNEEVGINMIGGSQAIVESVLNIVDDVLHGLKEMSGQGQVFDNPYLVELLTTIGKLASSRINLVEIVTNNVTSSFTMLANATQLNMKYLPFVTDANIAKLLKFILDDEEHVPKLSVDPIKSLQSDFRDLSNSVHLHYKESDLSTYLMDVSSQNLIATITYLTSSITSLPSVLILIREFHEFIEPNFQTDLLHITSNIRTLSDGLTLFVERRLIDLICTSSSKDKQNLEKNLMKMKSSIEPIILIFQKLVKSSIETVRNHMACILALGNFYVIPEYDVEAQILFRDTRQLIDDLDRILIGQTIPSNDNGFKKCTRAFEEVTQNSIKLRDFFNKSIQQINRYLL